MKEFVSTWWGVLIVVLAAVVVWFALSIIFYRVFFKRFYDIVISGIGLIVLSPLLVFLAFLTKRKIGKPVIFKQLRPGKNGEFFCLRKFRTLTEAKDDDGNLLPDDQRMTKYGKFLRSASLDELPEIWNIFVGDMSIVGPRPQLIKDLVFMTEEIKKRHSVRGGLTGLAQVNGRNNVTWEEKFEYDLKYVNKITLFGDFKIFFKTIFKVFSKSDIATIGMETAEDYGDYLLRIGKETQDSYDVKVQEARQLVAENSQKRIAGTEDKK